MSAPRWKIAAEAIVRHQWKMLVLTPGMAGPNFAVETYDAGRQVEASLFNSYSYRYPLPERVVQKAAEYGREIWRRLAAATPQQLETPQKEDLISGLGEDE